MRSARAIESRTSAEGCRSRPCSRRCRYSLLIPASLANSSRRNPASRRREPGTSPTSVGVTRARRARRYSPRWLALPTCPSLNVALSLPASTEFTQSWLRLDTIDISRAVPRSAVHLPTKENQKMITNPFQRKAYDAVAAALPFAIDPAKITVEPGVSYLPSPIKLHDYAAGVMAAFGSVVGHIGRVRGLPAQTMTLNRRLCGFHLNGLQVQFLNGYPIILDTWPLGPDNGTYHTKDGRYVTMIGLHPHLRDGLLDYFQSANTTAAIQAAVEKKTAQQLEDEVA